MPFQLNAFNHFLRHTSVQVGTPAYGEVLRGDIIAKIGEYDARDLSHADAQTLFRTAGNEIRIVVRRDNKIAYTQGLSGDNSVASPALLSTSPEQNAPHRSPSPFLNGPGHYERALQVPVDTLPHTVFPKLNPTGGYVPPAEGGSFSPMPTRDHQQEVAEEQATIVNQNIFVVVTGVLKFSALVQSLRDICKINYLERQSNYDFKYALRLHFMLTVNVQLLLLRVQ
ncbi:hypothetical protein GQX74_012886 [Glossina fuscipes]|nr:hypothetical protein GQX74_012886 [Glossina fuscipes]